MSKKVKFGIVGMGHIGKRHATMVQEHELGQLVGLCDIQLDDQLGNLFPGVPTFGSLEEMLEATDADVINVCTPNGLHSDQVIKALEHSKHVVCEKPMGLNKDNCEKIIFKSLQVSRQVFCVMQNRYSPPSQWLKQVLNDRLLGEIYLVEINCYWNRDARYYKAGGWKGSKDMDGGTLFTQFSHFIDIMYWLFGDIDNIQARIASFNHKGLTDFEDTGVVNFDFVNGGLGTLSFSTSVWDTNMESTMTVIGEKGTIKVGGQYMNEVEYCHIENYTMPTLAKGNPANNYGPYKGSAANHKQVIDNVIETITGKTSATTNALEGLKVVEIIQRIYENASTKQ